MQRAVCSLLLLSLIAGAPAAAQGPLARTYAEHGFSALASGDTDGALREFAAAVDLYPQYVDALVGHAIAAIAQNRLLEAWGDLEKARRYDDDEARKVAVGEPMQGIEVATRLEGYAAFLAQAKQDGEASRVTEWAGRFRAWMSAIPPEDPAALGFDPDEVLWKYAAALGAAGRRAEAGSTASLADAYAAHQMANWRQQQELYAGGQ